MQVLRGLDGLYVAFIERAGTVMHAVAPDFLILEVGRW